jgi:hypothetical protein
MAENVPETKSRSSSPDMEVRQRKRSETPATDSPRSKTRPKYVVPKKSVVKKQNAKAWSFQIVLTFHINRIPRSFVYTTPDTPSSFTRSKITTIFTFRQMRVTHWKTMFRKPARYARDWNGHLARTPLKLCPKYLYFIEYNILLPLLKIFLLH